MTTPDPNPSPLPCPFCGCADGLSFEDGSTYRWGIASCVGCGATAGEVRRAYPDDGAWHAEAVKEWNKRAVPSSQVAGDAEPEPAYLAQADMQSAAYPASLVRIWPEHNRERYSVKLYTRPAPSPAAGEQP